MKLVFVNRFFYPDHSATSQMLSDAAFYFSGKGHDVQVLTPVTALWLLFIPLVDIAGVIWRRSRGGRWPVDDDREHLHYLLVDRGYSTERVVNSLFVSALLLGSIGVALFYLRVSESWSYVGFMSVCVGYFVWTN